jgi:TRAP-type C4-dicarboxylate transport system permease small subunit
LIFFIEPDKLAGILILIFMAGSQTTQMKYTWWIFQILMLAVSIFFLVFGIDLMRAAYTLENPYNFIMTFFSASFILLISLALAISFVIKMIRVFKQIRNTP